MTATTAFQNIVRYTKSAGASAAGYWLRSTVGIRVLFLCLGICSSSFAQMTGGTISGTVTDSSQAAIPSATITILNKETGDTRTVSANAKGFYSAPSMQPGHYDLTASSTGFMTATRKDFLVNVGQELIADFQLQVGSVTESVQVTEQAPGVSLESSTLSSVVGGQTELDRYHWSDLYLPGDAFGQFVKDEEARTARLVIPTLKVPPGKILASQMWLLRNRVSLAIAIVVAVLLTAVYIVWQRKTATLRARALFHQLEVAQQTAERRGAEAEELARGLSEQIDRQLAKWGLTAAEHEVALLMLKGLRHKEIADLRGTSERTVRQQAATIYKKAGIGGRTDLAAFFMEDLLQPPSLPGIPTTADSKTTR